MLEDASIKLSSVAASLISVSARAMPAALIAGERDPAVLAQLARGKLRIKIPQLVRASDARPLAGGSAGESVQQVCGVGCGR